MKLYDGETLTTIKLPDFHKWPFPSDLSGLTVSDIEFLKKVQEANRHLLEPVLYYDRPARWQKERWEASQQLSWEEYELEV